MKSCHDSIKFSFHKKQRPSGWEGAVLLEKEKLDIFDEKHPVDIADDLNHIRRITVPTGTMKIKQDFITLARGFTVEMFNIGHVPTLLP